MEQQEAMRLEKQREEHAKDPIPSDAGCDGILAGFCDGANAERTDFETNRWNSDGRPAIAWDDDRDVRMDGARMAANDPSGREEILQSEAIYG